MRLLDSRLTGTRGSESRSVANIGVEGVKKGIISFDSVQF